MRADYDRAMRAIKAAAWHIESRRFNYALALLLMAIAAADGEVAWDEILP